MGSWPSAHSLCCCKRGDEDDGAVKVVGKDGRPILGVSVVGVSLQQGDEVESFAPQRARNPSDTKRVSLSTRNRRFLGLVRRALNPNAKAAGFEYIPRKRLAMPPDMSRATQTDDRSATMAVSTGMNKYLARLSSVDAFQLEMIYDRMRCVTEDTATEADSCYCKLKMMRKRSLKTQQIVRSIIDRENGEPEKWFNNFAKTPKTKG